MSPSFDPLRFLGLTESVALHVGAAEIFGVLKRSMDLPAKWAALVTRKTGEHVVVRESGIIDGNGADDVLFVRVSPIELSFDEEGIATRDGYSCSANVLCRVCILQERGELQAFLRTVVGSHRVAQAEGVARFLQPAVRSALAKLAADYNVAQLVSPQGGEAISSAIVAALQAPCFSAGLRLVDVPGVRIDSKTFSQVRVAQEESARKSAEHAASRQVQHALEKAQAEHLDHLESLLSRLGKLAHDSPHAELPELIRTFSPQQRGELYGALFSSEQVGASTRWIAAAAGEELLFFAPDRTDAPERRLRLQGPSGPIRAVQFALDHTGRATLLVGAAIGVYVMPIDAAVPELVLSVPNAPSVRGGFNAVALAGDRVVASHSELGICEWNIARPAEAVSRFESMLRGASAVRDVQFFDGNLYCSIDDRIIRWPAESASDAPDAVFSGSTSPITALSATALGLLAGNSNGDVLYWRSRSQSGPELLHKGQCRAAESVWLLSSGGVDRVIFTDTSPRVRMRVLGDSFACEYEAGGQILRRVAVAQDLIVATNELRDRLVCWSPGEPARPRTVLNVTALSGRSIQDACLIPRA